MEKQAGPMNNGTTQDRFSHGSNQDEVICGLVLAGGEGQRLQPFIKSLGMGTLPKQYVNFTGTDSMLENTWQRAKKLIPSERVFTVISEAHLRHPEVRQQLAARSPNTVIIQPENKETAPGLLLPLMHLYKRYPSSVVLVLPSDHFVLEEDRLMGQARLACLAIKQDVSRLVLLGVKPDREEPEYGYIVPGKKAGITHPAMSEISLFIEKPDPKTARRLMQGGGLWNTMIMAFHTGTMLHWVSRFAPVLYQQFQQIYQAIGTPDENRVVRDTYQQMQPINFSKELLEPLVKHCPSNLLALCIRDVLWSDWGTASRVMDVLRKTGSIGQLNGFSNGAEKRAQNRRSAISRCNDHDLQPFSARVAAFRRARQPTKEGRANNLSVHDRIS